MKEQSNRKVQVNSTYDKRYMWGSENMKEQWNTTVQVHKETLPLKELVLWDKSSIHQLGVCKTASIRQKPECVVQQLLSQVPSLSFLRFRH